VFHFKITYYKSQKYPKTDEQARAAFTERIVQYESNGLPIVYLDKSGFAQNMC